MFPLLISLLFIFQTPPQTGEPPLAPKAAEEVKFTVSPEKISEGDLVTVKLAATAKSVTWILAKITKSEAGSAKLIDSPIKTDLNDNGLKLTLAAPFLEAGLKVQEFLIYCVADGKVGTLILTVNSRTPAPSPGPVVPVNPTDPLTAELQAMFTGDKSDAAVKAAALKGLADLCETAASLLKNGENTTANEFFDAVSKLTGKKVPPGVLNDLKTRVIRVMLEGLPEDPDTQMTPDIRAKMSAVFARLALALKAVK